MNDRNLTIFRVTTVMVSRVDHNPRAKTIRISALQKQNACRPVKIRFLAFVMMVILATA